MAKETKTVRKPKSSLELAMEHKKNGEMTNMSLVLSREELAAGFGEQASQGMDADWNYLNAQINSRELYEKYITQAVREELAYKGNRIRVDETGYMVSDAISLFDGAALELSGAMAKETKHQEEGAAAGKTITGTGGSIVLAPPDADNAVIVPIIKFSISENHFEAEAKKIPGEGKGMPGFEQMKEVVFHGKEGMRLVAAQVLQVSDDQIIMQEIREYNYLTKSWNDAEDMTLSSAGFSRKENIIALRAEQEREKQQETAKKEETARKIRKAAVSSPTKAATAFDAVKAAAEKLMEDDEYDTVIGEPEEEMGTLETASALLEKVKEKGAMQTAKDEVTGAAEEFMEDKKTRIRMLKDAVLMYRDGTDYEEIEKALEEQGLNEAEQDKGPFHFELDAIDAYYPLFPFVQLYASLGLEADLKHYFNKPSFQETVESELSEAEQAAGREAAGKEDARTFVKTPVVTAGMGVQASASVNLGAGLSAGVPVLFELQGGVKGSLTLGGAKEKNNTLLAGTLVLKFTAERSEAGDITLKISEYPELKLEGSLELNGEVGVGVSMKSKIFGWDKDLYEVSLGEWNIATFQGEMNLVKRDKSMTSPLSNWLTQDSRTTVSAFGTQIYNKVKESDFRRGKEKANTIAKGTDRSKANYEVLLRHLRAFKEQREENPVIVTEGAEGFVAMADQAKELQEAFKNASLNARARLAYAIRTVENYRGSNEYNIDRNRFAVAIRKHQGRIRQAEETADTDYDARKAMEGIGYGRFLLRQAEMSYLFQNQDVLTYYQEKFREAAGRTGKRHFYSAKEEILPLLQTRYQEKKAEDAGYGQAVDLDFNEYYLKLLGSKEEAVRAYATIADMRSYEEIRRAKLKKEYLDSVAAADTEEKRLKLYKKTAKELTEKGNLSWMVWGSSYKPVLDTEKQFADEYRKKKGISSEVQNLERQAEQKKQLWAKLSGKKGMDGLFYALDREKISQVLERFYIAIGEKKLERSWQQLAEEEMAQAAPEEKKALENYLSRLLSVDMLIDYESRRLSEVQQDKREKAVKKHQDRVSILTSQKRILSEDAAALESPAGVSELEQNEVMEYFRGYRTEKGLLTPAVELKTKIMKGGDTYKHLFQNPMLQKQFQENMLNEYKRMFKNLRLQASGWETENPDEQESNLILQTAGLVNLGGIFTSDEKNKLNEILRLMVKDGSITENSLNMDQYMTASALQGDKNGILEKYERICRAAEDSGDEAEFLEKYLEIYTIDHVRGEVLGKFPYADMPEQALKDLYMYDEGWAKHDDRLSLLAELEASTPERYRQVNRYFDEISTSGVGKNFIAEFYERLSLSLTPNRILAYEASERETEETHYKRVLDTLGEVMDENGVHEGAEAAQKEAVYQKLTETDAAYLKEHKGDISRLLDTWMRPAGGMRAYSREMITSYEEERKAYYQQELDKLNQPIKSIQESVQKLTEMIADAEQQIKELENMKENPAAFLAADGLAKENPLVRVAELSESQWENPEPEMDIEELIKNVVLV